jgi:hypothetical protein
MKDLKKPLGCAFCPEDAVSSLGFASAGRGMKLVLCSCEKHIPEMQSAYKGMVALTGIEINEMDKFK